MSETPSVTFASSNRSSPYPNPAPPYDKAAFATQPPQPVPFMVGQPPAYGQAAPYGTSVHVGGAQPGTVVYVHSGPHPTVTIPAIDIDLLDQQYQTCCCHVKIAAYVIGILETIGIIVALISSIAGYGVDGSPYYYNSMIGAIIGFILGIVILALLFVGLYREIPAMILPHIVLQGVAIALFAILIIVYIVAAAGGMALAASYNEDASGYLAVVIVAIIFCGIALGLEAYFMQQMIRCYRYLRLKTHSRW